MKRAFLLIALACVLFPDQDQVLAGPAPGPGLVKVLHRILVAASSHAMSVLPKLCRAVKIRVMLCHNHCVSCSVKILVLVPQEMLLLEGCRPQASWRGHAAALCSSAQE